MLATLLTSFRTLAVAACGSSKGNGIVDASCLPHATADSGAVQTVINVVFAFSASIAVLVIVVCGFRYIVAHGDPNATAQAKNGILYSLVGLVIVMAAYSIVRFVVKAIA